MMSHREACTRLARLPLASGDAVGAVFDGYLTSRLPTPSEAADKGRLALKTPQ